ncbi:PEP/pyruvate-binding domain-containing protein [Lentzea sp. BCCO 10_0856]|uniref:PEP/pyruvate-binding domain-containing protein n=1 Tax=Lentzea miocenica TaxID=3095431 RepID=A0ABU4TF53_9PSEU|nr:PEP/pyruvate-binding domain-containing protein [Lentzea sp. BCCO 10_0856]MDX8036700.1 PEP/pyruvate-binding domain-containing protein [Lentzea sp. BCCO 10_0856]
MDILHLTEAIDVDREEAGGKASTLAELLAIGFPVPPGFVVLARAFEQSDTALDATLLEAAERLGSSPFAVRSSAAAEDLPDASYAGLYESFLNVPLGGLPEAVRACRASMAAARVTAYRDTPTQMAVLVQTMVEADAAGVAFTADPLTGDRDDLLVTAVRGLGERLVGGEAIGDQWTVRGSAVRCQRVTEHAVDADQVRAVAELARRVEAHFGRPQDIEWAFAAGRLFLMQARPMTALPDPVDWRAPGPGLWQRNFRLGEWLPEPLTPLFADWVLPRIIAGFNEEMKATAGVSLPFGHELVHGWYYTTPHPVITPARLAGAFVQGRLTLVRFVHHALVRPLVNPPAADTALLAQLHVRWTELRTRYQQLADSAESEVDDIAFLAGRYLWLLAVVGGAAWKMEAALGRFARRYLADQLPDGAAVLLAGLPGIETDIPPHAVYSLDWYHPMATQSTLDESRRTRSATNREAAENLCRAALTNRPSSRAKFDVLLAVAQRYAVIREQQARDLTLGWPLLRRLALLHGAELPSSDPTDIFFCTRAELNTKDENLAAVIQQRRTTWQRQRRLAAPLQLGTPSRLVGVVMSRAGAAHSPPPAADNSITGQPASPGRASGRVRILREPSEIDRFVPGEVLVAPTTTPAWTPLFAIAAAVITDGGNLAAHASLVAREYGIPAIVGTGNGTRVLSEGQTVAVDGTTGVVSW